MEYSLLVSWIYFGVYVVMFFITSIICAIIVQDEYKHDKQQQNLDKNDIEMKQTQSPNEVVTGIESDVKQKTSKKHGCTHYIKKWAKLVWAKRKIYLQIIPHLFDQATDIGVILQYYQYSNDGKIKEQINTKYLFYSSIIVLISHRIISSFGIWQLTRNWFNVFLQLLDVLMIRSVWTSYKLGSDEPSTTQRYLGIMEATFEAMPQLLMATGFLVKTNRIDTLIIVSLVSSLWSLTARVSGDDKMFYKAEWRSLDFSYKTCPIFNWRYPIRVFWRFLEISGRLCFLTLLWVNLGGFATFIIIGFDICVCILLCIAFKSIGNMGNLMYVCLDSDLKGAATQWDQAEVMYFIFLAYRAISTYLLLIAVTVFATVDFNSWKVDDFSSRYENTIERSSGLFILIYCWIATCCWPCIGGATFVGGVGDYMTTSRDSEELFRYGNYMDVCELIEFGKQNVSNQDKQVLRKIADGESGYYGEDPDENVMTKAQEILNKLDTVNK